MASFPYHDIMVETEYWWECLVFQCNIGYAMFALFFATNTPAIMNQDRLFVWWKSWGLTYVAGYVFGFAITWCVFTMIWIHVMGLRYPIPFGGTICQLVGLALMVVSLWFQMPKAWRMVVSFKSRAKWVIVFHLTVVSIALFYKVLWIIMANLPEDYQPVMAVLIPLIREGLGEILKMIGQLASLTNIFLPLSLGRFPKIHPYWCVNTSQLV